MIGMAAALAGAAAILLFSALRSGEAEAPVQAFTRTANPNVIVVRVLIGQGGRVTGQSATEDAQRVHVSVRVAADTGAVVAIGIPQSVQISLRQPLGERVVVDAKGNPVREEQ